MNPFFPDKASETAAQQIRDRSKFHEGDDGVSDGGELVDIED